MEFYVSGDVAPGARFKYSFTALSASAEETTTEAETHVTTAAPMDTTETEAQTEAGKQGGCKSSLSAVCVGVAVTAGAALTLRKKKEEE